MAVPRMEHRRPVSPIRSRVDWNTMTKPATALATVPMVAGALPPGQAPLLAVNHWMHVSQSPSQLWRPGLDRGERLAETMLGQSGGLDVAAACGWQPGQIHEHMHARVHRVYKKPPPPPPPPPPPDEEDLPAWQILRKDDGTENLDLMEAIGTLELALYVPVPLPWENAPEGRRRQGIAAGRHTAGFITTVRELASRAARRAGDVASSLHSSLPSREREYAAATADLVRRTESIAVMTSAVMDGKPAANNDHEVAEGRPMTTDPVTRERSTYPIVERNDASIRAFRDDVMRHIEGGRPLVDVRSPQEFSGELLHMPDYPQEGSLRGGHIPGARNVPWKRAANEDGSFKSAEALREIYVGEQGLSADDDVVAYCRIGERSSHTWFVLHHLLGFERVRNYDGSWTEWGNLVRAPIER